ncbi:Gfo/Idh/MocA family protein [Blastochloris sulfoviridis]|uniref:Gfo/Idh/MocA family oxidoreductase n=1 Tax=Blastochloris sulfoviridis TaxID=50712 RepID=A0A5M6HMR9_9HYPH|nr:Gfo/Idh/MocA family oxidoreductase [Blastochloris sulfoviridis]KAA5597153.1 Gfo/Idh/MocA family oxidoreductase [Blastochloris sulfoviridis]
MAGADEMRVGLIGLGHIGKVHLAALERVSGLRVVALCDRDRALAALAPPGVAFFDAVEPFFDTPLDTVVVATPNDTHAEVALAAMARGHSVLVEKPAARSRAELEALMAPSSTGARVHFAFHAAHGREVEWARLWLAAEGAALDEPVEFDCAFTDPYVTTMGELVPAAVSLGDCWSDSGINALSVVAAFVDARRLKPESADLRRRGPSGVTVEVEARFTFGDTGRGKILTRWTQGINHKQTRLGFSRGASLLLDHSRQKIELTDPAGERLVLADFATSGERLLNHYLGLFTAFAEGRCAPAEEPATGRRLHELMFAVAATARPTA